MEFYADIWVSYPEVIYSLTFVFGICLGSFASALSYRVPRHLPWVYIYDKKAQQYKAIRSACPSCSKILEARDLIPLLSWIMAGGRCRHCKTAISVRYPMQELASGILACLVLYALKPHYDLVIAMILSMPFAIAAIIAILQHRILPYSMLLIIILICLSVLTLL